MATGDAKNPNELATQGDQVVEDLPDSAATSGDEAVKGGALLTPRAPTIEEESSIRGAVATLGASIGQIKQ